MPIQQDVPSGRWRHPGDQRHGLGVAAGHALRQYVRQNGRVVVDDRVGDQARALVTKFEAQELDICSSVGAIYWEGLSELRDPMTQAVRGIGYLEMTGYAHRLSLG